MSRQFPRWMAVFATALALALPLSLPLALDARGQSAEEIFQQAGKFFDEENYTKAAPLFRKAAKQGNARAQFNLGNMYFDGEGVEQDYKQAVHWYRKAAAQGDPDAQHNLGLRYYLGQGVLENYQQAFDWWKNQPNKAFHKRNIT